MRAPTAQRGRPAPGAGIVNCNAGGGGQHRPCELSRKQELFTLRSYARSPEINRGSRREQGGCLSNACGPDEDFITMGRRRALDGGAARAPDQSTTVEVSMMMCRWVALPLLCAAAAGAQ